MGRLKTKAQWISALKALDEGGFSSYPDYGLMSSWLLHAFTHKSEVLPADTLVRSDTLIDIVDRVISRDIADDAVWIGIGTLRWLDGDMMAPWGHHCLARLVREIGGEDISLDLYAHLSADYMAVSAAMRRFVAVAYPRVYAHVTQVTHKLPKGGMLTITPILAGRSHLTLKQRGVVISMMGDSFDAVGSSLSLRIAVSPSLEQALKLIRVGTEVIEKL